MSTILDALRKTEEKGRGQSLDTRTRILMLSTRHSFSSSPRRSMLWIVGASFILGGFVAGMWIAHKRTVSRTAPLADNVNVEEEVSIVRSIEPASLGSHSQPEEDSDAADGGISLEIGGLEEGTPFRSPLVSRSDFSASDSSPAQRSPFARARQSPQLARVEPVSEPQVPADLFDRRMSDDEQELERESLTSEPMDVPGGQDVPDERRIHDGHDGRDAIDEQDDLKGRAEQTEQSEQAVQAERTGHTEVEEPLDGSISAPAGSAVSFLQWSPETTKRKAFVRVGDGPLTLVHEGDSVGGYTVVEIQQGRVGLRSGMAHFYLRVR